MLRDMVMDVAVEGKPAAEAAKRGQQRAEQICSQQAGFCEVVICRLNPRRRQCRRGLMLHR